MDNIRFEVYSEEIENSMDEIYYSQTLVFRLKKYDKEKLVFDEDVTLIEIERGRTEIPMTDYEDIEKEFCQYLDIHNENLMSRSIDIKFEITDIDSRYACAYKEYLNGKIIKEGRGWAKDLDNPREREAWDKAVIKFKKENGIETSTDRMKRDAQDFKDGVKKIDSELPGQTDLTPPLIETAIPKLVTDPCNFVNSVIQAAEVSISRINGFPSPVELANYYIKIAKNNISSATTSVADAQQAMIESAAEPVMDSYEDSYDYFMQLDAEREEFLKTHPDEMYLFDVVDYQEPVFIEVFAEDVLSDTEINGGITINGGNRNEVLAALGFTGTDTKDYCNSKMAWGITIPTISGEKKITVHKDLVEEVKSIFNSIYNIGFNVKQVGGYTYRKINNPNYPNTTKLSMHSFGCAIDINWSNNPFYSSQKRPFEYPPDYWKNIAYNPNECIWTDEHPVVRIFKEHDWGWGGRYGDFMHFSKANGG